MILKWPLLEKEYDTTSVKILRKALYWVVYGAFYLIYVCNGCVYCSKS